MGGQHAIPPSPAGSAGRCRGSSFLLQGCVLFLCGSTGVAGDSLRYVRMLAGMGYIVLAPDHMASNSDFFSRNDASVLIRYEDVTDYWERNLLYEDDGAKVCDAGWGTCRSLPERRPALVRITLTTVLVYSPRSRR